MDTQPFRDSDSTTIKAISVLLGIVFVLTGCAKLVGVEMMIESFRNWGYSVEFMYLVGVLELGGALMILTSRFRYYGATLLSVIMIGAVFTHVQAGEWLLAPAPLVMLILTGTVAWKEHLSRGPRERHA